MEIEPITFSYLPDANILNYGMLWELLRHLNFFQFFSLASDALEK